MASSLVYMSVVLMGQKKVVLMVSARADARRFSLDSKSRILDFRSRDLDLVR